MMTEYKTVVQVGSNRGFDPLSFYLKNNNLRPELLCLVEANPMHFDSLRKCYEDFSNAVYENFAVVPKTQEGDPVKLYLYMDDGPGFEVTSCDIMHVIKHYKDNFCITKIKSLMVPSISLESLLIRNGIFSELDWLLLDVEGIDAQIINDFDWNYFDISRVEFEHLHLGEQKEPIFQKFIDMGYTQIPSLHEYDVAFQRNHV